MTMQEEDKPKFKELHCGFCNKYMGFVNVNHEHFTHDFFCSLKCVEDNTKKEKEKK